MEVPVTNARVGAALSGGGGEDEDQDCDCRVVHECGSFNAGKCRHHIANNEIADDPTGTRTFATLNLYASGSSVANGYIIASGYDSLFPSTSVKPPVFGGATPVNLAGATDGGGVQGLGLATGTDHPYIGPSNGLLLNFSNVKTILGGAPICQINFNLYKDITGGSNWEIFGTNSNTTAGWAGATLIASGAMAHTGTLPVQTNSIFTYYAIGLESDCAIDLRNVQVEYATPEPGTFAMLGIGAVAVLILRKKLTGRRG